MVRSHFYDIMETDRATTSFLKADAAVSKISAEASQLVKIQRDNHQHQKT